MYGTFDQRRGKRIQRDTLEMKAGKVTLKRLELRAPEGWKDAQLTVKVEGRSPGFEAKLHGEWVQIEFAEPLTVSAGDKVEVRIAR